MNARLKGIAQSGDVNALYALNQNDANVFRRVDRMEFVDTPLHVAAAAGHTDFAMEIMNLKPSFARKLNPCGYSPIHVALQYGQTELVIDLLSIDKDLVRVKGREGYTPLHCVAKEANLSLLSQFLDHCPYSILDLTNRKETALHIVAQSHNIEVFKAILEHIQKIPEENEFNRRTILNLQDKDGNTGLHIAASNNQSKMIKLLTKCKEVDKNKVNRRGFTPLNLILERQSQVDCRESVNILKCAPSIFSKLLYIYRNELSEARRQLKPDTVNVLLIIFALVLTVTYQAFLSPPGGVFQGDGSNSSVTRNLGKSVIKSYNFSIFYLANTLAFYIAWGYTVFLLEIVAKGFRQVLFLVGLLLGFSSTSALSITSPGPHDVNIVVLGATIAWLLIYCYFKLFGFYRVYRKKYGG